MEFTAKPVDTDSFEAVRPYRHAYDLRNALPCVFANCPNPRVEGRSRCIDHLDRCLVDGCENPRLMRQSAQYCAYHAAHREQLKREAPKTCEFCRADFNGWKIRTRIPTLCGSCYQRYGNHAKAWARHGVPIPVILAWLNEPRCFWCDELINLITFQVNQVHVDHDHKCCSGVRGCPNCYRGLTHPRCNIVIGNIEKSIELMGVQKFSLKLFRLVFPNGPVRAE
jgi:recombination endonuclease VII